MRRQFWAILLTLPVLLVATPAIAANVYIPHITAGSSDWDDYLLVNNTGGSTSDFTLTLYGQGSVVYSQEHSVAGMDVLLLDLKALASTAEAGSISFDSDTLLFRLIYENENGGMAEFVLTDAIGPGFTCYFSDISSAIANKGAAIANLGDQATDVTLFAVGSGSILGSYSTTITPWSKLVGLHSTWFPDVAFADIRKIVIAGSNPTLAGLVISSTATNSNLLFTSADFSPNLINSFNLVTGSQVDVLTPEAGRATLNYQGTDIMIASGRIVVELADDADSDDYADLLSVIVANGYQVVGQMPDIGRLTLNVGSSTVIETAVALFLALDYVEDAYPDVMLELLADTCDGLRSDFRINGFTDDNYNDAWVRLINAKEAWKRTFAALGSLGLPSVGIGIVDGYTQIDSGHFACSRIQALNTMSADCTDDYHGTRVAALAGASGWLTDAPLSGVSWDASLLCYDWSSNSQLYHDHRNTSDYVLYGVKRTIENNARVVNLSIGIRHSECDDVIDILARNRMARQALKRMALYAERGNSLIVLANGNVGGHGPVDSDDTLFPSSMANSSAHASRWADHVLLVTSAENDWSSAYYSMLFTYPQVTGDVVDIAVPMIDHATFPGLSGFNIPTLNSASPDYEKADTSPSYAAPIVSGSAALLFSLDHTLTPSLVKQALKETVQNPGTLETGVLDLRAAVVYVLDWYKDKDGDGYSDGTLLTGTTTIPEGYYLATSLTALSGDCDDDDDTTYPGAPEICGDFFDNDCDGVVDEECGTAEIWYQDADGDGYGTPYVYVYSAEAPPGYVTNNLDCHDLDADMNPGEIEICDDGLDNNCDGVIDEWCHSIGL